mmetsp:Transcript_8721/g.17808  ORF Transcript_8721/g.17808 Transcript_8721/m.17808 type:complete len:446 (-) Transcript_8721:318-1655(-)
MSSGSKRKAPPDDGGGGGDGRREPPPGNLGDDLLSSLENPALCDVTLVGSDGGRIHAIRSILAARSRVLERMLVGPFREANQEDVAMDFPAAVLKALVHFCCTDDFDPDMTRLGNNPLEQVRNGVKLCEAAHYYQLEKLGKKAGGVLVHWGRTLLQKEPAHDYVICAGFDESVEVPSLRGVYGALGALIRQRCDRCLLSPGCDLHGVTFLRSNTLWLLVNDPCLAGNASSLFKAVKLWAEMDPDDAVENIPPERRTAIAKRCVSKIHLRLIPPALLVGDVMKSGLVTADVVISALSKQAQGGALYVTGAGTAEINGMYEQTFLIPDLPEGIDAVFQRSGKLDGEEVTFAVVVDNHFRRWSIFAPPKNARHVTFNENIDRRLYKGVRRSTARPMGLHSLVDTLLWDRSDGKFPGLRIHIAPLMASIETTISSRRSPSEQTTIYKPP